MFLRLSVFLILFTIACPNSFAQTYEVQRDSISIYQNQPFQLKRFIIPHSEKVSWGGEVQDSTTYTIDYRWGKLWLRTFLPDSTTHIIVAYKVFPFSFSDKYTLYPYPSLNEDSTLITPINTDPQPPPNNPFEEVSLQRSGSLTRGIIAGNRRDVTLESGFQMQLSGEVADGISINAVLTDANTPIQPEGTTQRLNEFDRVLIELQGKQGRVKLGDFDLNFSETEFARFSRKMQGVSVQANIVPENKGNFGKSTLLIAGATSRGIYQNQTLAIQEAVQGPYRLEGKSGEQFIIILAGSEKVYLDGGLLVRGESNDYVIDYASGEITFSSNILITAEKRINVEFEYTTYRSTRTLIGAKAHLQFFPTNAQNEGRLKLTTSVLREADSSVFSEELGLSEADLEQITLSGDKQATIDGAMLIPFDAEAPFVQYVSQDTTYQGITYSIYRPVKDLTETGSVYRIRFSRVPENTGDYRRVGQNVNGILYEWVGENKGNYIPKRILPQPKEQVMVDTRLAFEPSEHLEIFGELAQSVYDINRLSPLDDTDNQGLAWTGGVALKPISIGKGEGFGSVNGYYRYRKTATTFEPFDRINPIEYSRIWNLNNATTEIFLAPEAFHEGKIGFQRSTGSYLRSDWGNLNYGNTFTANRKSIALSASEGKFPRLKYQVEQIQSTDAIKLVHGNWTRQKGEISNKIVESLIPSLQFERELRAQTNDSTDVFLGNSFGFTEYRPALSWETEKATFESSIAFRNEDATHEGKLIPESQAVTSSIRGTLRESRTFFMDTVFGYRVKNYTDTFIESSAKQNQQSVVIKWNSRFSPLERAIDATGFYEALTERAPIMQEIYREVQDGLGNFVWEDANEDGLQQIDEFLPITEVNRLEGKYIRLLVPSDSLKPVINVETRFRIALEPSRLWKNPTTQFQKVLSAISARTEFRISEKSEETELVNVYLLRKDYLRDSLKTINGQFRFSQNITFFRQNPRFGGTFQYIKLEGLNRLATGAETQGFKQIQVNLRYKPTEKIGLNVTANREINRAISAVFSSRTFDILEQKIQPELTYYWTRTFNTTLTFVYAKKEERYSNQLATMLRIPIECVWLNQGKFQWRTKIEYAHISLPNELTGLAGLQLTEGRGVGSSFLWNSSLYASLSRILKATISYDGRVIHDAPTLHTVRLQVNASF